MKVITEDEVGKLIKDGDMVAVSGEGGAGSPEALLSGVMNSFLETGHPCNIGVTCGISPGNLTNNDIGMNKLAKPGLVGRAVCAHLGMGKVFGEAIAKNEFPAFVIPLGVMDHLYRAIAAKEVGILTHIGIDTCVDPRQDGCRANEKAKELEPIVELMNIDGEETLFFRSFPINVALIKATYADEEGNVSLEHEGIIGEQYNMAIAAHNHGGIVIAQVEEIKPKGSLKAKNVLIHKSYVDYVVLAKPDESLGDYNLPGERPEMWGDIKIPLDAIEIRELDERKVCGRRSAMELKKGDVVNLGVGMPDSVANVAAEEGFADEITLSIETGVTGGVPIGGVAFGSAYNPESIIAGAEQLDAYDGGSLDMAILGLAQVDRYGNVNVSKFGTKATGPGGFINITQTTKKIVFMGTFTAKGIDVKVEDNKINIVKEGENLKFVNDVIQVTFSGKNAIKNGQEVLYITERCVFKLTENGLLLTEIAPGIDLEKDILAHMEFKPQIAVDLRLMDERIFRNEKMGLKI